MPTTAHNSGAETAQFSSAVDTDYAVALMGLPDEELRDLAMAASYAATANPRPSTADPLLEGTLAQHLSVIRNVVESVDSDSDLTHGERLHLSTLVQRLADALEAAPQMGPGPVETAAKAVIGDSQIHRGLWERIAGRGWARKLGNTVISLLALVAAYSSGKEMVMDLTGWLHQPPAIPAKMSPPENNLDAESEQPG